MRSLFIVLSILISISSTAQSFRGLKRSQTTLKYHYTGVIGGKYKFQMNLSFNDKGFAGGEYRYYTQKSFINLKGVYERATKVLDLTESVYNHKTSQEEITGYFKGTWEIDTISGTWYNKDKTKTFPFALSSNDNGSMPGMNVYDNAHLVDSTFLTVDTIAIQSTVYKTQQLLTGLNLSLFPDTEFISFEDINFDGYLDLLVIEMTGAKNTPMLYWVYDKQTHQFIKHDELQATIPVVDVQHKRIISRWFDGAAISGQSQYVWQDGMFYLIEESETDLSTNKSTTTKYKIENGKSVKITQ